MCVIKCADTHHVNYKVNLSQTPWDSTALHFIIDKLFFFFFQLFAILRGTPKPKQSLQRFATKHFFATKPLFTQSDIRESCVYR